MPDTTADTLAPVVRRIVVHCSAEHAFRTFTDDLAAWWPVDPHAVGTPDQVATIAVEPGAGGRVVERWHDGTEHEWARFTTWDPPQRLVMAWHPGHDAATATEVEVTFTEERASLTRLVLDHRGWEARGDDAARLRESYDAGWIPTLTKFKRAADDPEVHRVFGISLNNEVWAALARTDRTPDDDARMVDAAHASLWHWAQVGTVENLTRGEWMCSHVYAVVGRAEPAVHHARRANAIVEEHGIGDFDAFYAAEGMARALACAGDPEAAAWRARSVERLAGVPDPTDREICEGDLAAGPWFGLG